MPPDRPIAICEVRPDGRLFATNVTLRNMLRNIERVQEFQLVGGPDWIETDRWNILRLFERASGRMVIDRTGLSGPI